MQTYMQKSMIGGKRNHPEVVVPPEELVLGSCRCTGNKLSLQQKNRPQLLSEAMSAHSLNSHDTPKVVRSSLMLNGSGSDWSLGGRPRIRSQVNCPELPNKFRIDMPKVHQAKFKNKTN